MSDSVNEQLSACLDGELPETELDFLLKRSARDATLRRTLGRYAFASEAIKGDKAVGASADFAARVMSAIEGEARPAQGRLRLSPQVTRRLRPVAGFAIAAGVAAMAVLSVQRVGITPAVIAVNDAPAPSLAVAQEQELSYTVPSTTSVSAFVPATRLTNYVVAHSEYSSPLGRRTVLSGVLSDDAPFPEAETIPSDEPPAPLP